MSEDRSGALRTDDDELVFETSEDVTVAKDFESLKLKEELLRGSFLLLFLLLFLLPLLFLFLLLFLLSSFFSLLVLFLFCFLLFF